MLCEDDFHLEPNLGTYIHGRISTIQLPNRRIWSGTHERRVLRRIIGTFFVDVVFGLAFLIGSIGTYARFLNLPSAALRQAEDVRLVCLTTRDLTLS